MNIAKHMHPDNGGIGCQRKSVWFRNYTFCSRHFAIVRRCRCAETFCDMPFEKSQGVHFAMVVEEGVAMQAAETKRAKGKWQVLKIVTFLLALVLLTACTERTIQDIQRLTSGFLTEQAAIEKAVNYCQTLGTPQETPHNFRAEFSTWQDVKDRFSNTCHQCRPDLKVWVVTMDGTWLHSPPPPASGSPVPIPFNRCRVLMNAQTEEELVQTN